MLLLISYVYYIHIPDKEAGIKFFVGAVMLLYIVNHFFIMSGRCRPWQLLTLLFVDSAAAASFGFLFAPGTLYLILFGVHALTLFLSTEKRVILVGFSLWFLICWSGVLLYTYILFQRVDAAENIISFMFVFFQALVGSLIRKLMLARQTVDQQYERLNESHISLQEAHEQLRLYAKEVEMLTVIRERNHIAREIHDTVGHNMTALLVQIQLAQELLKCDSKQAEQTLQTCYDLARNSLQEVRISVRTLREDEAEFQHLVSVIRTLLEDFSNTTNIQIEFELKGDPTYIPTSLHPTFARIVQEALTNAKKHGGASRCIVALACFEQMGIVSVEDNGTGAGHIHLGFGLINMKERVEEHGGDISFQSKEGAGFQVRAEFPLQEKKWTIRGSKQ